MRAKHKAASWRDPDKHPRHHVCVPSTVVFALRIANEFRDRQPTVEQLMVRFEMSRATAFRWRAAWQYVCGPEMTPAKRGPKPKEALPCR